MFVDQTRIEVERQRGIWPDRVITDYFDGWLAEKPDATAIIDHRADDGSTTIVGYGELNGAVAAMARNLTGLGVGKGDVVSMQLPNWWQFVAVHLACVRIGAITNPLMPIFRHRELSFMLRLAESKVFIVPETYRDFDYAALGLQLGQEVPSLARVFVVGASGAESFEDVLLAEGGEGFNAGSELRPNDLMQLLFTSGTTGEPKGVLHVSNALIGTADALAQRMEMGPDDVIFMPSPIAHQSGFMYGMMQSLMLGVPLLLMDVWEPASGARLMQEYRASFMFAATPFLSDLANLEEIAAYDLDAFRLFVTAGAPIPPEVVAAAHDRLGAIVVSAWGMTENGCVTTTGLSGHKVLETDGKALPGEEVRVVDDEGVVVADGTSGNLQFRGAANFVGYLKRPEFYRFDDDGWFDTGDLARMDDEGYIRIEGRKKDIIIRGGENIPVVEIENALYRMAEVRDAAVVAMPDARLAERACAFATLKPGATLTLERIKEFLEGQRVAKQYWPERLEVIDKMPRTPSGKIQKFVLRDQAQNFTVESDQ